MDNASYRDSKTMADRENDSDGGLARASLPKYAPRLNPMEILWRDPGRALAGSCSGSIGELKAAMTEIVQGGEPHPAKLVDCMPPDGAGEPGPRPLRT